MTCATVQLCILESGSTFDHSDVVQQDISACWLEDRKTVVCTKSFYISSLQHKKHHHHSSWIFLLALLKFWQKRSNLHLSTRKMWENLPVVWQKKDLLLLCSSDNAQSGEVGRNKQITAIEILTPDIGLSLWRQIAPQTNARSRDSFSSFAISPQSSEC